MVCYMAFLRSLWNRHVPTGTLRSTIRNNSASRGKPLTTPKHCLTSGTFSGGDTKVLPIPLGTSSVFPLFKLTGAEPVWVWAELERRCFLSCSVTWCESPFFCFNHRFVSLVITTSYVFGFTIFLFLSALFREWVSSPFERRACRSAKYGSRYVVFLYACLLCLRVFALLHLPVFLCHGSLCPRTQSLLCYLRVLFLVLWV